MRYATYKECKAAIKQNYGQVGWFASTVLATLWFVVGVKVTEAK